MNKEERLKQLSQMQYYVTQQNGTEPPYQNEFDQHFEEGIYVDIVSGKPLLVLKINLMPVVVGQAFQNQLWNQKLLRNLIRLMGCVESKSEAKRLILT